MTSQQRDQSEQSSTRSLNKQCNLERCSISPPPLRDPKRRRTRDQAAGPKEDDANDNDTNEDGNSGTDSRLEQIRLAQSTAVSSKSAQIESAQVQTTNHLAYFSQLLTAHTKTPYPPQHPRLAISNYSTLYQQAETSPHGAHFVVTQHDHPIAGPHYDLRLQINETSSCSWAIMYGLPGDPNSLGRSAGGRVGAGVLRNATETRVHCLWNHLIETGARQTGSLMIWDMGRYEILEPRETVEKGRKRRRGQVSSSSEDECYDGEIEETNGCKSGQNETQQQKLARAFANRKIRLRLHGVRLPQSYTVNLRLTQEEDAAARTKAADPNAVRPRRRRQARQPSSDSNKIIDTDSSSGEGDNINLSEDKGVKSTILEDEEARKREDEKVRLTNAYTGASNSIGSIHQRKWFLSLDREACGFTKSSRSGRVWWQWKDGNDDERQEKNDEYDNRLKWPFYVRGPDNERSLVTGRLGSEILRDEGVTDFVGRKGWRPILR